MRKIIASLATSADGFIARPDGDVAWLDRPQPRGNYGMGAFMKSVDTIVMGRATYDVGKKLGPIVWPGIKTIILSRSLAPDAAEGAVIESGSAPSLVKQWRRKKGKDIWLMGGAVVFGEFLDAGVLDELTIHVVPVLIGSGIPLLAPKRRATELELLSSRKFSDGSVQLRYAVK